MQVGGRPPGVHCRLKRGGILHRAASPIRQENLLPYRTSLLGSALSALSSFRPSLLLAVPSSDRRPGERAVTHPTHSRRTSSVHYQDTSQSGQGFFAPYVLSNLSDNGREARRSQPPPAAKSPSTTKFCYDKFSLASSHPLRFQPQLAGACDRNTRLHTNANLLIPVCIAFSLCGRHRGAGWHGSGVDQRAKHGSMRASQPRIVRSILM